MNDVVFRSKAEPVAERPIPTKQGSDGQTVTLEADVPYTDYENMHGKPYTVDYFKLGDTWKDNLGGFVKEVSTIEEYFTNKINSGEIANSPNAVKEEFRKIEKLTNMSKEERTLVKIETIAAHVEYMMKLDKIKFNLNRYGKWA